MPAYVIYQAELLDPERYEGYKGPAAASVAAAGGRYLVRGGSVDVLEGGESTERTVILEFPDRQAALDWYHGRAYTEARALRQEAARARMFVIDGYHES
jgi:uncharacterized protein (DUF1330 family)